VQQGTGRWAHEAVQECRVRNHISLSTAPQECLFILRAQSAREGEGDVRSRRVLLG
jgi:hypothetical protein